MIAPLAWDRRVLSYFRATDPEAARPAAYVKPAGMFSPGLYEGFVNEGFIGSSLGWMDIKPIERIGGLAGSDRVALVAPERPKAVWVEGRQVWSYSSDTESGSVGQQQPATAGDDVMVKTKDGFTTLDCPRNCLFIPLRLPEGASKGAYQITALCGGKAPIKRVRINGVDREFIHLVGEKQQSSVTITVPLSAEAPDAVVGIQAAQKFKLVFTWEETP